MTSASTEKCTDQRARRQLAIMEKAAKLFADLGYANCEMERVAGELSVAKGTLYLYFSSKEELFLRCVDHGMQQMQAVVNATAEGDADPLDKVAAGIFAYLQFFREHPQYVELLIQERANFKNRPRPTFFDYRESRRQIWRHVYQQLADEGRLQPGLTPDQILDVVGNLLYGTMFTNHFVAAAPTPEEQLQAILAVVRHGILRQPS
jgi:AcrR family transcriptional regulator